MHILRHMAAAQAPEAGPPRACMLFSFFFFTLDPAESTSLLHSVAFFQFPTPHMFAWKCVHVASGGERRGRGLVLASRAWLGWTTLSSSSVPQPPRSFLKLAERIHRLSGGDAGTNWHVGSFMESSGLSCREDLLPVLLVFFCESLHACRDHACNVHTHRPSEHVWVCYMKNKCELLSKSCLAAIKSSDPDTQR